MKRKLLIILLAIISVCACAFGFSACGDNGAVSKYITFEQNRDGSYYVKECKWGISGKLELPSTYNDLPVTGIGQNAFYNCTKLTSITIPDSVKSIGSDAFQDCSGLTSITIPNGVVGSGAFYGCSGLKSVTIGSGVEYIYGGAFDGCSSLTKIYWNAINCSILDSISNVSSIIIGNNVVYLPWNLFRDCDSLKEIIVGKNHKEYASDNGILYNKAKSECLFAPQGLQGKVVLPNSVTSISYGAFSGCSGLTSITIPANVTNIGDSAFSGCSVLKTVYWNALNCTIDSMHDYSNIFKDCTKLTDIIIGNDVAAIPQYAFYNCSSLTGLKIGNSVISIGDSAFSGCSGLTSISIPASVTSIGESAFFGCSGLTSISIPASVTSIGDSAFSYCSELSNITVESGNSVYYSAGNCIIKKAGKTLILGCKNSIIPDEGSVISIGKFAFEGCIGLTNVTIADGVTIIGRVAFKDCSGLLSITIPNSVTSIGSDAFSGCDSLTSVYYKGTEAEWANITITTNNEFLTNAARYYYSETEPTTDGNYWHYDTDGVTPILWKKENAAA